jgi:hypothetical protein
VKAPLEIANDILYQTDGQPGYDVKWPKVKLLGEAIASAIEEARREGELAALERIEKLVCADLGDESMDHRRRMHRAVLTLSRITHAARRALEAAPPAPAVTETCMCPFPRTDCPRCQHLCKACESAAPGRTCNTCGFVLSIHKSACPAKHAKLTKAPTCTCGARGSEAHIWACPLIVKPTQGTR